MIPRGNDPLVSCLAELVAELDKENLPVILGGGLSQYLRGKFNGGRSPRYPFTVPARSTEDLDIFLSPRLIADAGKIEGLRRILAGLGYQVCPEARNFQFKKTIRVYGQPREVKVDLLAAPPAADDAARVTIKRPRIKPKGAEDIHAYLTDESEGLELGKIPVPSALLSASLRLTNSILFIPSVFNFLILKLHAFNDRKDKADSDFGRHHAWDLFAAVAGMAEGDWTAAKAHLAAHAGRPYLKKAAGIRASDFSAKTSVGLLRLQDNEAYKRERAFYDNHLGPFIQDLAELFRGLRSLQVDEKLVF